MSSQLPVRLGKEPLIDAVFEVRFASSVPGASNLLPGYLFSKLKNVSSVESLPNAQIPQPIRDMDPAFHYAPLTRFRWNEFFILVGERVISIACALPYPGWTRFKEAIVEILVHLGDLDFVTSIERCSIKYLDLFDFAEPLSKLNVDLRIGESRLTNQALQLKAEIRRDSNAHAVQIVAPATVQLADGRQKTGTILEVDTVHQSGPMPKIEFLERLSEMADNMHQANKKLFFECISQTGLASLEPTYE